MKLPKQKTQPKYSMSELIVLLHARSKFGKSTWCAQAEDVLFLATEPGLNHLETYQIPIDRWEDLLAAYNELAKGDHSFKTIVIDTIDNAHRMCTEYICKKFGINHESDLGYGKGYALVNNEFQRLVTRFAFLPQGFYMISHCQEREVDTQKGKVSRIVPTLPTKARKTVLGLVDLILYGDIDVVEDEEGKATYKRVLRTKPSLHFEAGDRTGKLPATIDFDYQTFVQAFENATKGE